MSGLAAVDNLSLLEVMRTGDPATKPGPAARAFYHETVGAAFRNPTQRNAFLNNAWNLWKPVLSSAREWEGYADRMAVRRTEFGATVIVVDAHGLPTSVQANPNDAQNELRFKKYRPNYRQTGIELSRDEYTPITVDPVSVGRLMAEGFEGDAAAKFLANQLTQVLNANKAREFNTLFDSFARFIDYPGIFYVNTVDLNPATISADDALSAAVTIRATVKNLQDFTNRYSTAKHTQTVPADQVRLIIGVSAMQAIGRGYGSAFNTENVLALPESQIIEVPDRYFAERPQFAGQSIQWALIDAGTDQGDGGTFIVVDSLYEMGSDPFNITQTYNQALHHASFLDVNPFKTLIVGGPGEGSSVTELTPVPDAITLRVYTDMGTIDPTTGVLPRGVEFSTEVRVTDAQGHPAGAWSIEITGSNSPTDGTGVLRYMTGKVSEDELAATITVTATSTIDPSVTVSQTYTLTGDPIDKMTGNRIVTPFVFPGTFDAGSGSGGTYTYTAAVGVLYEVTNDDGTTWEPLAASPAPIATGDTVTIRARAAGGYVFADGTTTKADGPHTAA